MAAQSASSRARRRHSERPGASAASALLGLRRDGMAAAEAKRATQPSTPPRRALVHAVTESSSEDEASPRAAVVPASPAATRPRHAAAEPAAEAAAAPVVLQEYVPTRNVADMVFLFTNDRLKEQPATVVLRSDPYCIPRVTDNVPEYRPRFNPLSILEAEEQLLPGHFRLDPTERVPGAGAGAAERDARPGALLPPLPAPAAAASAGSAAGHGGKSSAFMGSMPRQKELPDSPISETVFHSFKLGAAASPPAAALLADVLFPPPGLADAAGSAIPSLFADDAPPLPPSLGQQELQEPQQQQQQQQQQPAKKLRAKSTMRQCSAPGCIKGARGKSGLCQRHGGGRRCAVAGCPKGAQGSSAMCLFHGGGYRCTVPGCATGARGTSGLCAKHGGYKRAKEAAPVADAPPPAKRPRE